MTAHLPAAVLGVACASVLASAGVGCETDAVSDGAFVEAVPSVDLLIVDAPGVVMPSTAAADGRVPSPLYAAARATAAHVNATVRAIVGPLDQLVHTPPTRRSDRRIWQRAGDGGREEHRLTVVRVEPGYFEFALASRALGPSSEGPARWRARAFGTTVGDVAARGRGSVWVDFDADRRDETTGMMLISWSRQSDRHELDVSLFGATDGSGENGPRTERFVAVSRAEGGELAYGPRLENIHQGEARSAIERVTYRAAWLHDIGGRSDLTARGGDVAADGYVAVVRSECWEASSFSVGFEASYGVVRGGDGLERFESRGDPAACVDIAPMLADVAPVGSPPDALPTLDGPG